MLTQRDERTRQNGLSRTQTKIHTTIRTYIHTYIRTGGQTERKIADGSTTGHYSKYKQVPSYTYSISY